MIKSIVEVEDREVQRQERGWDMAEVCKGRSGGVFGSIAEEHLAAIGHVAEAS